MRVFGSVSFKVVRIEMKRTKRQKIITIFGILLLLIGCINFVNFHNKVNYYESPEGKVQRFFYEEAQQEYEQAQTLRIASVLTIAVGIILTIITTRRKQL